MPIGVHKRPCTQCRQRLHKRERNNPTQGCRCTDAPAGLQMRRHSERHAVRFQGGSQEALACPHLAAVLWLESVEGRTGVLP